MGGLNAHGNWMRPALRTQALEVRILPRARLFRRRRAGAVTGRFAKPRPTTVARVRFAPSPRHGQVAKWEGAGLQPRYESVRFRPWPPRAQGVCGCMPDCQSEGPGSTPGARSIFDFDSRFVPLSERLRTLPSKQESRVRLPGGTQTRRALARRCPKVWPAPARPLSPFRSSTWGSGVLFRRRSFSISR